MAPTPIISAPPAVIEALSSLGTALVFCMCAAQLPAFRLVALRRLDVAKISFLPTLGQLANFSTWTMYGVYGAMNPTVVMVNLLGCAFCALYVTLFLVFSPPARRPQIGGMLAAFAVAFGAAEAAIMLSTAPQQAVRQSALAYVSIACNVVMYGSPIGAMRAALSSMDPAAIPLLLTVASLLCSLCWGLYGLLIADCEARRAAARRGAALTESRNNKSSYNNARFAHPAHLLSTLISFRPLGRQYHRAERGRHALVPRAAFRGAPRHVPRLARP